MSEPVSTSLQPLRDAIPERIAAEIRKLGSDVDLLVEYVPGRSGFAFVEFCEKVEELFERRVDVVTEKGLPPLIRDKVLRQAVAL